MCQPRTCPECATTFTPRREHGRFCQPACAKAWNNRNVAQGGPMVQLVKAWLQTRHAKPGTREADICRYARAELTRLGRQYLDDDAAHDRDPLAIVGAMMDAGDMVEDRQQASDRPLEKRKAAFLRDVTDAGSNYLAATLADVTARPIRPRSFQAWQARELRKAITKANRDAKRRALAAERAA